MRRSSGRIFLGFGSCRLALAVLAALLTVPGLFAQITGTLTGTVYDQSGAVVPNAKVKLLNQKTNDNRETPSNGVGYFSFVGVTPGAYTVTVEAAGFKTWKRAEITLDAGDVRTISNVQLAVGNPSDTISVEAVADEVKPVDSGERSAVLTSKDFDKITLESRDAMVLMKILPGVSVAPNMGGGSGIEWINTIGAQGSLAGNGLNANGVPNRGGTSIMNDGANIIDPGCNCWGIQTVDADMTEEIKVQTSNFGADSSHGPVVINTIGKAGGSTYHGEGYLHLRNGSLNSQSWEFNHTKSGLTPQALSDELKATESAHYYYPGGQFGGPVPGTKKKVLFWVGYEHFYQNLGGANSILTNVPTSDMMAGNFTNTAANLALCPGGFSNSPNHVWCQDINGGNAIAPNGTVITGANIAPYIDPGALVMAKIWPVANADPNVTGGYNYKKSIPSLHNGYILRARGDYNLNDNSKLFVSWQTANDGQIEQNTGAHMWWVPGNAIQFPGGGLQNPSVGKTVTGHFVHVFSPTFTNEFIASWGYGSSPIKSNNPSASYRSTLGYPNYGTVFKVGAKMIPSFNSPNQYSFPDFSQADVFENPTNSFPNRKEMPSFTDNLTKVWRSHTFGLGAFYERTGDYQAIWVYPNGQFSYGTNEFPDQVSGITIGSKNPVAAFLMGEATGYEEDSTTGITDMAYHTISGYIQDSWKTTRRLTVNWGFRFEHIGRWYDRQGAGMAVWLPGRLNTDLQSGKLFPGLSWHGIDPGIPNSGSPVRSAFVSPRLGLAYDLFGTGKTVFRGGWGAYRWNDQYNDYANALETAQGNHSFNLPGNSTVTLAEVGQLNPGAITWSPSKVYAADPNDYNVPVTYSYNFTISQQLPGKSLFELAYVGNTSSKLLMGGGSGSSAGGNFWNQNKVALGALFSADPLTAAASNPGGANIGDYSQYGYVNIPSAPTSLCKSGTAPGTCFVAAYADQAVYMGTHVGYANYNALQASWLKRTGRLTFDLNYTWSKALATNLGIDAFRVHGNYGAVATDRTHVINTSYALNLWSPYRGDSKFVRGAADGWVLAGLTTWQAGGNIQAIYSSNLNLAIDSNGSIGNSYFGTNAQTVMPTVSCNPGSGLGANQRARLSCFGIPTLLGGMVSPNGPRDLGYMRGPTYFDSDLALYKTFKVTEKQSAEFRFSAFNFLNHPVPSFSTNDQMRLTYTTGSGFAPNPGSTAGFGNLDYKDGKREIEVALKYIF